jgi:hypothetical protein
VHDPAIKYGGGADNTREMLKIASEIIANNEKAEITLTQEEAMIRRLPPDARDREAHTLRDLRNELNEKKKGMVELLNKMISKVENLKG